MTATPNQIAEYVACANVPAARTAQRYVAQRPNGFVGRVPVYVTTDFVSR